MYFLCFRSVLNLAQAKLDFEVIISVAYCLSLVGDMVTRFAFHSRTLLFKALLRRLARIMFCRWSFGNGPIIEYLLRRTVSHQFSLYLGIEASLKSIYFFREITAYFYLV